MSQRLREWWTGGGFFSVATIVVSAAITWGATIATINANQQKVTDNYAALSRQIDEVKAQIHGVRSAQDGVLQLQGVVAALTQRILSLETDYKTQVQVNAALQADIARLKSDTDYLRRN